MKKSKKKINLKSLAMIPVDKCRTLRRNPQLLSRSQMESLKRSISRDGFVAPILVRKCKGYYEIVSGNHRFMAAVELGHRSVPAVVAKLTRKACQRLAVNLNLIHGEPPAVLLAPFLAEMDDDVLADIHLDDDLLNDLEKFDIELSTKLKNRSVPEEVTPSTTPLGPSILRCRCPTCGKDHIATVQENTE